MKGNKNSLGAKRPKEQLEKLSIHMLGNTRVRGKINITYGFKNKLIEPNSILPLGWKIGKKCWWKNV